MEVYIFMASNIKGQLQSAIGSVNTGMGVMAGMKQMAAVEKQKLEDEENATIDEYRIYSNLGVDNKLPVTPDTVSKLTNASIDLRNNERMKDIAFEGSKGDMSANEYADELSDMATEYQRRLTSSSEQARVEAFSTLFRKRSLKKAVKQLIKGGKA